jgi:hypothetical protein
MKFTIDKTLRHWRRPTTRECAVSHYRIPLQNTHTMSILAAVITQENIPGMSWDKTQLQSATTRREPVHCDLKRGFF